MLYARIVVCDMYVCVCAMCYGPGSSSYSLNDLLSSDLLS